MPPLLGLCSLDAAKQQVPKGGAMTSTIPTIHEELGRLRQADILREARRCALARDAASASKRRRAPGGGAPPPPPPPPPAPRRPPFSGKREERKTRAAPRRLLRCGCCFAVVASPRS